MLLVKVPSPDFCYPAFQPSVEGVWIPSEDARAEARVFAWAVKSEYVH